MSKVVATYWDNTHAATPVRRNAAGAKGKERATPQWFVFVIILSLTFMMCLAINLRSYSEMSQEEMQNQQLTLEFEKLSSENLGLQEEIHNLKRDSKTIEREARKIGMSRPNEKILVPTN